MGATAEGDGARWGNPDRFCGSGLWGGGDLASRVHVGGAPDKRTGEHCKYSPGNLLRG